ncbi:MAG TPA: oligosaccharide flippase family protein [Kofleriaceae bacterium]|jgi:hypothetical protein|nr:oligosaccharide flippase family protein [Kofleriaceae bacterium]
MWTMVASMAGRAVGALGTLVITRFLEPQVIGEVTDATIVCMSASWIAIWGVGQYTVVKGRGDATAEVRWHATLAYLGLGAVSLGLVGLVGGRFTPLLDAPHAAVYVPGMALAIFIRRLGAIPERVLTMQLEFRASGLALALGEIVYTAVAVSLAALGVFSQNWAGMPIVIGNLVQSFVVVLIFVRTAGIRSWATPTRLRAARFRDMLRFGVPLGLEVIAHQVSCYWDNLAISHFFGAGSAGIYNMAYNLADLPAAQLGEQVALVLLPSMAELPPSRRPAVLERASALLAIVIFSARVRARAHRASVDRDDPAGRPLARYRAAAHGALGAVDLPADRATVGAPRACRWRLADSGTGARSGRTHPERKYDERGHVGQFSWTHKQWAPSSRFRRRADEFLRGCVSGRIGSLGARRVRAVIIPANPTRAPRARLRYTAREHDRTRRPRDSLTGHDPCIRSHSGKPRSVRRS